MPAPPRLTRGLAPCSGGARSPALALRRVAPGRLPGCRPAPPARRPSPGGRPGSLGCPQDGSGGCGGTRARPGARHRFRPALVLRLLLREVGRAVFGWVHEGWVHEMAQAPVRQTAPNTGACRDCSPSLRECRGKRRTMALLDRFFHKLEK